MPCPPKPALREDAANLIQQAIGHAVDGGQTRKDEQHFARIEAMLRDALGQDHGVWRWRVREDRTSDVHNGDPCPFCDGSGVYHERK
jgi:hypothetical protein